MTEEMQQWLMIILGAVALTAVIGWILTYLRLRGTYFVAGEDSLKITYYYTDEEQSAKLDGLGAEELGALVEEYLAQAERGKSEVIHLITGADVMVRKEDSFVTYARGPIRSIKPPPMRIIAIQIELIPKEKR